MNWRGRPLESHEVIVNTIAATTTGTGLTVHAELDTRNYPNGIKITDQQMEGLEQRALRRHDFHGEWNYTLVPQRTHDPPYTSVLFINSLLEPHPWASAPCSTRPERPPVSGLKVDDHTGGQSHCNNKRCVAHLVRRAVGDVAGGNR